MVDTYAYVTEYAPLSAGGLSPFAYLDTFLAANPGSVYWATQEETGDVAGATNSAVTLGRNAVINGDFANWTGVPPADVPDSWTVDDVGDATSNITENPAGSCQIISDGTTAQVSQLILVVGKQYRLTFDIDAITGTLLVRQGGTTIDSYTSTGSKTKDFTAVATALNFRESGALAVNATIDNVTVKQTSILASSAYPGAELATGANVTDDGGGNETNAITNWVGAGFIPTVESTIVHRGSYSLKSIFAGGAHRVSNRIGLNYSLVVGKRYLLSFWWRHGGIASGTGAIKAGLGSTTFGADTTIGNIDKTTTTYTNIQVEFVHSANTEYLAFIENNAENDGTLYVDDLSVTEANPLNANHTGVTVGQPGPGGLLAVLYDGATSYTDAHSAELNSMLNPAGMTIGVEVKGINAAFWTDNTEYVFQKWEADPNNYIRLSKNTSNQLQWDYMAGGTLESVTLAVTPSDYFSMDMTAEVPGNMIAYYNGATTGSPQAIAGTFVGNLDSTKTVLGAETTTPTNVHNGYLTVDRYIRGVLTAGEIATLHSTFGI